MKVATLLARLAVYATALFVVVTAQLPEAVTRSTFPTVRTHAAEADTSPARFVLAGILVAGILIEVLRRRPVWH
jgi:hypothetical protein